jgi:DNA-binding MarR family transcriptional regulator
MPAYLSQGSALNELMRESFLLHRSLLEAAQQLTESTGVTGAQWGVLTALGYGDEARTVAEAARQMGLTRQSVQRVADVLAAKNLVKYLPNPADKRAKLVEVTAPGRVLLKQLEERQRDWVAGVAGNRSDADINAASELVKNIRQHISAQVETLLEIDVIDSAPR